MDKPAVHTQEGADEQPTPEQTWNDIEAEESGDGSDGLADAGKGGDGDAGDKAGDKAGDGNGVTNDDGKDKTGKTSDGGDPPGEAGKTKDDRDKATDADASAADDQLLDSDPKLKTALDAIFKEIEVPAEIIGKADPKLRAAYDATRKHLKTALLGTRRAEGHQGVLARKVNDLTRQLDTLAKQGAAKPAPDKGDGKTVSIAGMFDTDEMKKIKEEYPEVMGPFEQAVRGLESQIQATRDQLRGLSSANDSRTAAEHDQAVRAAHPDYDDVVSSRAFQDWYLGVPDYIQAAVERNGKQIVDSTQVVNLLAQFKRDTGYGKTKQPSKPEGKDPDNQGHQPNRRQHQLESASAPRGKGTAVSREGEPTDPEAIWKQIDAEEARRPANR